MIQAGTSQHGKCPVCGKPWVRQTAVDFEKKRPGGNGPKPRTDKIRQFDEQGVNQVTTIGWSPSCTCLASPALMAETGKELVPTPVPCTVLDPFAGSGTTLLVARNHQRHAIGIELNPDYCRIAAQRLAQLSLLT